ncbi:MAG TPA: DUF58 domain-containing protein [Herpetosiphonaceae bacterium]
MWPKLRGRIARALRSDQPPAAAHPKQRQPETPVGLLRRMHWTVLRPLATHLGGDERSLVRGSGMELAEVREYQPGDDVRHIDWNTTARTDRPFVREALTERALDVWLIVDVSASLNWGTAECLKRERALEFAAVAGQLFAQRGHRLGALLFADRPLSFMPPGAGQTHLLRLLDGIQHETRHTRSGATDLAGALARVHGVIRRRSLLIVVSDFLAPTGWQTPLALLAQRHELIAVRLHDPREAELPDIGLVTFEDPETGSQLVVNTHDRGLRERFQQAALEQAARIRTDLARCGAEYLALGTDTALLPVLVRFLSARRLRRTLHAPASVIVRRLGTAEPTSLY